MEKAYDLKELGARLKAAGLVESEDLAEQAYQITKQWIKESAVLSETPYDNLVIPFIDQLDALVLPKIDKIDGQEG